MGAGGCHTVSPKPRVQHVHTRLAPTVMMGTLKLVRWTLWNLCHVSLVRESLWSRFALNALNAPALRYRPRRARGAHAMRWACHGAPRIVKI